VTSAPAARPSSSTRPAGRPRTFGQSLLARAVCRTYAITPCVITVVLGAAFCAVPHGVLAAAVLTGGACFVVLAVVPAFREQPGRLVLNAALYFTVLALPAAVTPVDGWLGLAFGGLAEGALDLVLLMALPHCGPAQRLVQPELLPDILTGLLLVAVFGVPVQLSARGPRLSRPVPPPWDVVVLVCAHEERSTIEACLRSIRTAARAPDLAALVRSLRVVLVDSGSTDGTREAAAPLVDATLAASAGKLSARHEATLAEPADVVIAADGDRTYGEGFLLALLRPLADDPRVVATLGETANAGSGLSGSALSRRVLAIPMNAGNSACYREAYFEIPFDVAVNQFRHVDIWTEEEFLFAIRMRGLGRVVHTTDARSYELRPYRVLDQVRRHLFGRRLRTF
jgi:hypothetical protein